MGSTSAVLSVPPVARRPHRAQCAPPRRQRFLTSSKSEGERDRKFADSLLKGTGLETAVPRKAGPVRDHSCRPCDGFRYPTGAPLATRNRWFESFSLQGRVCEPSVPPRHSARKGRQPLPISGSAHDRVLRRRRPASAKSSELRNYWPSQASSKRQSLNRLLTMIVIPCTARDRQVLSR